MWPALDSPFAAKEMALATTILTKPELQPSLLHQCASLSDSLKDVVETLIVCVDAELEPGQDTRKHSGQHGIRERAAEAHGADEGRHASCDDDALPDAVDGLGLHHDVKGEGRLLDGRMARFDGAPELVDSMELEVDACQAIWLEGLDETGHSPIRDRARRSGV